jgi:hypothetical protein
MRPIATMRDGLPLPCSFAVRKGRSAPFGWPGAPWCTRWRGTGPLVTSISAALLPGEAPGVLGAACIAAGVVALASN